CKPLAVLLHEIHIMESTWHRRVREKLVGFWSPMDLRHFGTVGKRLAVAWNASLVGVNHHRICEDHSDQSVVLTGGNNLPAFVTLDLREREPAGYLQAVLVLIGKSQTTEDGELHRHQHHQPGWNYPHDLAPL